MTEYDGLRTKLRCGKSRNRTIVTIGGMQHYAANLEAADAIETLQAQLHGTVTTEYHDKIVAEAMKRVAELEQTQKNWGKTDNARLEARIAELEGVLDRMETLAVKWVDAGHHDWTEIKSLIAARNRGET